MQKEEYQEPLLTEKEVSRLWGISLAWLQRARCHGYGPEYIKMRERGGVRYEPSAVNRWIEANRCHPKSQR